MTLTDYDSTEKRHIHRQLATWYEMQARNAHSCCLPVLPVMLCCCSLKLFGVCFQRGGSQTKWMGFEISIAAGPVSHCCWSNTRLCRRWSARPMGSWTQTIRWQFIPTLRSRLRQRWKWSTRPSMSHTPATPLPHVHLSLPLFSSLPLSLSLSQFLLCCWIVTALSPSSSCHPATAALLFCLTMWVFDLFCCPFLCCSVNKTVLKKEMQMQINFSVTLLLIPVACTVRLLCMTGFLWLLQKY